MSDTAEVTAPPQTPLGTQPPHVDANADPNVPMRDDKLFKKVQASIDVVDACINAELDKFKDVSGDPSVPSVRSLFAHIKNVIANERNDHTLR